MFFKYLVASLLGTHNMFYPADELLHIMHYMGTLHREKFKF